jgi:polysaccharide biosynthesis/export protein
MCTLNAISAEGAEPEMFEPDSGIIDNKITLVDDLVETVAEPEAVESEIAVEESEESEESEFLGAPESKIDSFEYIIGLGDILEVSVWKEPELSKKLIVRIDGRVSLPLVGEIQVAGKSISSVVNELKTRLEVMINEPMVSVALLKSKSWRYYIIGKVKTPGEFTIEYPITILQAIARSGGFLQWAKKSEVRIVRKISKDEQYFDFKEVILDFDYNTLVDKSDLSRNIEVKPGDTIIIP